MRQAEAFYELLCDLGFDRALDQALTTPTVEVPSGRPVTAAEQAPVASPTAEAGMVRLDLGAIFRQAGREGMLRRLAAIVLGGPEEDAGDLDLALLEEAYYPFASRSLGLIKMLLGSLDELA